MNRLPAVITGVLVGLAGLSGIALALLDMFGFHNGALLADIELLTIALIATTLGIEALVFRQRQITSTRKVASSLVEIERRLTDIDHRLLNVAHVRQIRGSEQIYADGIRLVGLASSRIRSIVVGNPNKAPMAFTRSIVAKLQQLGVQRTHGTFHAVIVVSTEKFNVERLRGEAQQKIEEYRKANVDRFVSLRALAADMPMGFDVLIVDRRHVSLAFTSIEGTDDLMVGYVFEDQPQVAEAFAEWFDQRVFNNAARVIP